MSKTEPQFLVIGEILKPWGFRGEVKVKIVTDFPGRIPKLKTVYVGPDARALQVERARLHSGSALFKFEGYNTEESVAKLRGQELRVSLEDAAPLREGQYYHHQIIGLRVQTREGDPVGEVEEILETGANDVYLVRRPDGRELLIPAVQDVVQEIDLGQGRMTINLLPGMAD